MRIGLDFTFLAFGREGQVRGIPRFTQDQVQAVLQLDSQNTYLLLCDARLDIEGIRTEIRRAPNVQIVYAPEEIETATQIGDRRTLLARFSAYQQWLEDLRVDLFHATCPALLTGVLMPGFDACPYVATAYDLIPMLYPAHYLPDTAAKEIYEQRLVFLEQATRIAAISHATAADIVEHLGVAPERIDVTPPAPSPVFRPLPPDVAGSILRALDHPSRQVSRRRVQIPQSYVLCITSLHYSKNLTTLLPAYSELPSSTRARFPLVVAGHLAPGEIEALQHLANQLHIGGDLIITGRVSDEELAALYNGCTLTVHPSHHEGFGLPVAEAMRAGAAVITTTRSALPETAGDAAVLVDSDDATAFTKAIDLLLHDSERRDDLSRRGIAQAARYTPALLGETTLRCYERTVSTPVTSTQDTLRVALWSPIPPQDAPVASYTDDLVSALSADTDLELDLFVDDVLPPLHMLRAARIHHHSDFERAARRRRFDTVIYEVGASPAHGYMAAALSSNPGVVVLHDLRWSHALHADRLGRPHGEHRFRAEIDALEGERAAREWDRLHWLPPERWAEAKRPFLDAHPMLGQIVASADRCVTVTPALGDELVRLYPQAAQATVIPLGVRDPTQAGYGVDRPSGRAYLGLDRDAFILLTQVVDGRTEHLDAVLMACTALRRMGVETLLNVIGAIPDAARAERLRAYAESLGIAHALRLSGPVGRVRFDAYLAACDVLLELSDLGAGEIPDGVMRAFAAGRCVVLADSAGARSLPEPVCIRILAASHRHARLTTALMELADDGARRGTLERAARRYYEDTARLEPMAAGYRELIREQSGRRVTPRAGDAPRRPIAARRGRPAPRTGPLRYNKVIELEDFAHADLLPVIRDVCAHKRRLYGDGFPAGYEHRKDWEVAMAVRTLADHGALRPDARILGVAAGSEDTIFYLTRHAREVVANDLYMKPGEWEEMAPTTMLVNPARMAPFAFDREHLTVQHMDARVLDYPDESFDGIFSSGSIEHFGDLDTIAASAYEMGRVLKPGGILTVSTELLLVRDPKAPGSAIPFTRLLSPAELYHFIIEASGLEPIDPLDLSISHWTLGTSRSIGWEILKHRHRIAAEVEGANAPEWLYWELPHVVMESDRGERFTSVHLALRRAPVHPVADNSWARPTPALRADVTRGAIEASGASDAVAGKRAAETAAAAAALAGELHTLSSKRDAAEERLADLCAEVREAAAVVTAQLEDAALPHPGVYVVSHTAGAQAQRRETPMAATPSARTIELRIDARLSPPYTVVIAEDADDVISAAFLAGRGADINLNLISLILALVPAGGTYLDLGANIGSISLPVAAAGRRVLSVEADSLNAELLGASVRASGLSDRMRVIATAVGDRVGEASFVPHGCHGQLVDGDAAGATRIPLTTVDALLESQRLPRVDLVKIDVEGAELDVLHGLAHLAQRADAPYLLVECCTHTLTEYGQTTADLISILESYGYAVYNVDDNRLMRRHPDEVQVTTVMDVLAAKQGVPHLTGWRVEPPMTRREIVDRFVAESRIWNPDCRAATAREAELLDRRVLRIPAVAEALNGLLHDAEPMVRVAAGWWRDAVDLAEARS